MKSKYKDNNMTRTAGSLLLATILAISITGCNKKLTPEEASAKEDSTFQCKIDGNLAPKWACGNGLVDGSITAVGSAPLSKLGQGFSRREAMANGRSNLAQQIQTLVKDKVETFTRSTGVRGAEVADKVSTQVSKQVARVSLSGSKQVKYWQNPTNSDIYVLMSVSENSMNEEIKNQVKSSYKNDNALWQQFQSKQALEGLEKEFPTE
jgi:hypothetical protein